MRRFLVGLCCVVVGLQVLIGVPAAVCLAFVLYLGSDVLGPISFDFRVTSNAEQAPLPVPIGEPPADSPQGDAVLEARAERGSLLSGTLLGENLTRADEQREFVAAFRQIAAEIPGPALAPANPLPPLPSPVIAEQSLATPTDSPREEADRFAIDQLYTMADKDEYAGVYDRADQWRALARAIRGKTPAGANADSIAPVPGLPVAECP